MRLGAKRSAEIRNQWPKAETRTLSAAEVQMRDAAEARFKARHNWSGEVAAEPITDNGKIIAWSISPKGGAK